MHQACREGHTEVAKVLLAAQSNANVANKVGCFYSEFNECRKPLVGAVLFFMSWVPSHAVPLRFFHESPVKHCVYAIISVLLADSALTVSFLRMENILCIR